MKRRDRNKRKGFTMAELLLLLAVLAVAALIVVPIIRDKLEEAYQIADVAQARSVYGVVTTETMTMPKDGSTPYYYDGKNLTTTRPKTGYGKSSEPFESFVPKGFPVKVTGIPKCAGEPMCLMIKFNDKGVERMIWGGYPIVTTRDGYREMSQKEKLADDRELLDALQSVIRKMTYGQLKDLFWDDDHDAYHQKFYAEKGYDGGIAFTIALSDLDNVSGEVLPTLIKSGRYKGLRRNQILSKKLFEQIGYNTGLKRSSQYLIYSHEYERDGDKDTDDVLVIKVNLPKDPEKAKKRKKASGAVVYLSGNGIDEKTDRVFGYDSRKESSK